MGNVVRFQNSAFRDIDEILDDAFREGYQELILIGMRDGDVTIHHSSISRLRLLGALEMAKYQLLADD